jgi:hypothetical protein
VNTGTAIDGLLVQWGDRLFYPGNRIVRIPQTPHLSGTLSQRAAAIRRQVHATVVRRAPQVMVKVTGGGRGMAAIAAHFRYITKNGERMFEDDRGLARKGKDALRDVVDQWRYGGSLIEETSPRREAFNIMLSMRRGTDPLVVQQAAREFAAAELADHRYVMVLHDHQFNPHVHICVRAESRHGERLNPRKADLQRWRETFAEKLRGWGIEAEATRQATRGELRNYEPLWRDKARQYLRLRTKRDPSKTSPGSELTREEAAAAWTQLAGALRASDVAADRALAERVRQFVLTTPFAVDQYQRKREREKGHEQQQAQTVRGQDRIVDRSRGGPEISR